MKVKVSRDGVMCSAEIIGFRNSNNSPVKVKYNGEDAAIEVVGGDRLRSKALKVIKVDDEGAKASPKTKKQEEKPKAKAKEAAKGKKDDKSKAKEAPKAKAAAKGKAKGETPAPAKGKKAAAAPAKAKVKYDYWGLEKGMKVKVSRDGVMCS